MKERHICPKCNKAAGWHGPPYQGKLAKLKAILFWLRYREPPFLRCLNCGKVVTVNMWKTAKRTSRME